MTLKAKKPDCIEQQEILQAVVIADNFGDQFLPLAYDKPTALFPLVNKVLIDYPLEILAKCGIQETYVFCKFHVQQIRNYVNAKWAIEGSGMTVTVFSSESFTSVGDVIRELDSQALIRSDFVLINGDTVMNLNLNNILEDHKRRRKIDKGCSMTLIYRKALPKHRTRCLENDVVIAVETESKKVRFYQKTKKKRSLQIPAEVLQENSKVTIHYNMVDCHTCICSPSVPPLYADNFDYQTLDDLIKGLIINEEILGSSMYLHFATSGYAANVTNLSMYDMVSRDIIQRWSYPVVPDLFPFNGFRFHYHRHNIYKETGTDLHSWNLSVPRYEYVCIADMGWPRTCELRKNVVIGKDTIIGENSVIEDSVIGRKCIIGANVSIKGCYLWDEVTIGDNCKLNTCILADHVCVRENVSISEGCVLAQRVVIGDHVELPALTKLQSQVPKVSDSFDDSDSEIKLDLQTQPECEQKLVGAFGKGYLYIEDIDSDNEDEVKDIWCGAPPEDAEDDDDDSDDEKSTASHSSNDHGYDEEDGLLEEEDTQLFYNEVLDSLERGIEEKIKSENLILEINSSKYAYNVTMKEVNSLVIKAILTIPLQGGDDVVVQEYFARLKQTLRYFIPLIGNYIKNASSQLDCLQSIEDFVDNNKSLAPIFGKIIHFLYGEEILNESVILKWYDNSLKAVDGLKKYVTPFVKWLREADEESSSE